MESLSHAAVQRRSMQSAKEINLEIKSLEDAFGRAELNAGGGRGGDHSRECLKQ